MDVVLSLADAADDADFFLSKESGIAIKLLSALLFQITIILISISSTGLSARPVAVP